MHLKRRANTKHISDDESLKVSYLILIVSNAEREGMTEFRKEGEKKRSGKIK